ncbi:MAG TPA: SUF system Fe-S cluster assembly protein [Thermoanaerobaculia bacterium]|jgi:FeS assembly SUF system protein|nr:SUF system Fe-S cluster assembly protein [Thermoanaerobaculia bacterium]
MGTHSTDPTHPTDPAAANPPAETTASAPVDPSDVENGIVEALKTVFDPEIPVNIYELGLIYDVDLQEGGKVQVKMTLTSPGCPVAGSLPGEVKAKVEAVPGVASAEIDLVWDPAWNPSMMSEAARLQLGMF